MRELEDYLHRVVSLVDELGDVLTAEQREEVMHLVAHGEPAEGLRTLAWIICDESLTVDRHIVTGIRQLTDGLIDAADLPSDLHSHVDRSIGADPRHRRRTTASRVADRSPGLIE